MAVAVLMAALGLAFFEALSRVATPREARRPLRSLTVVDHLVAAYAGLVLLTRDYQRTPRPYR